MSELDIPRSGLGGLPQEAHGGQSRPFDRRQTATGMWRRTAGDCVTLGVSPLGPALQSKGWDEGSTQQGRFPPVEGLGFRPRRTPRAAVAGTVARAGTAAPPVRPVHQTRRPAPPRLPPNTPAAIHRAPSWRGPIGRLSRLAPRACGPWPLARPAAPGLCLRAAPRAPHAPGGPRCPISYAPRPGACAPGPATHAPGLACGRQAHARRTLPGRAPHAPIYPRGAQRGAFEMAF